MTDPFVGKLTFFRVYSGVATAGSYVLNSTKDKKERLGRILLMHANTRKEIDEVYAGDIAAAVGFKNTTTGDTFCAEDDFVILEKMEFPEPVIELAIEPKTKADQNKLGEALVKLAEEDLTFRTSTNPETVILSSLVWVNYTYVIVDRLKREFHVKQTLVFLRLLIEKLLLRLLNVKVNTLNSLVVVVSTVTFGSSSNLMKVKDLNSLTLLLVDQFQENISVL